MMNIQQYPPYYPYHQDIPIPMHSEGEVPKYSSSSNYNDLSLYQPHYQFQPPYSFPFDFQPEQEQASQIKHKKIKKNKNNDQKSLLPKTLESEKQAQEDPGSTTNQNQGEQMYFVSPEPASIKSLAPYPIYHYTQGAPLPKLQSDIQVNAPLEGQGDGSQQTHKQKGHQQTKKPKKEHINTGHWSTDEHSTYIKFLQQYENIMTSSMMKKTSKIFKQMSELIGTRTPSQCRSHHQKFNPYALRGENGKRLPRTERSRAGRKKKNPICDAPKAEDLNVALSYQQYEIDQPYYMMVYDQKMCYIPTMPQDPYNWVPHSEMELPSHNIKKEEEQENQHHIVHNQEHYEEYLKGSLYGRNLPQQDFGLDARNPLQNDLLI